MANVEIKLSASKRQPYTRNRVVGRVGDNGLTTIDVQLLESDEATPFALNTSGVLKFVGQNAKGEYVEGTPTIIDSSNGLISYTFTKEDFSASSKFKTAYFEYTDPNSQKITFQDFIVDVLPRADISAEQATYYISSLERLLNELRIEFDHFIAESTLEYEEFYSKYNELVSLLNNADLKAISIAKKVEDAIAEFEAGDFFNKQESSANVIYQIIGKENFEMTFTMDFKEKVKGSVNENPNTLFGLGTTTLPRPAEMTTEVVQERYTAISEMDGNTVNSTITDNAYFPKFGAKWNLVEHVKKVLGEEYFLTLGAATLAQQVALLRTKITSLSGNSYGYGHSPSGYKISMGSWLRTTNTWESVVSHASDTISKLTIDIDKPLISNYIDDNGFFYTLVYSDPSDGKTATKIVTDYTNVVFTMEISANEYIQSMIAAYHVENLATQAEAETGLNDSKTMTPLRVFQAIAKWTTNKFVSLAGNETILGIKNFTGGLLANNKRVLTVDDITQSSGTVTLVNGNTGSLKYTKQLNTVTLTFNVLNGRGGGTPSGSLIATLPEELAPASYFEHLIGSTDRSSLNTAMISIGTNKEIRWQRNSSTASDYSFEVTYQTN
ncbi:BppU family phage baseplate upper protein [Enterococcus avium]|uniref:BppU family phage baseplate upper protein n=1 Tax=Enterococcus avium TaxID=33945 RepID=UPI00288FE1AB|nr:BppU family phage baseplate upper protein [Enterococcus avium]MDT2419762.1 BppU family phage baseplate upper protein [Enterococcus avium]MDT2432681.1 BppU family phage baseplate upper protein [Enterococcus avium]